jgi:hypothetical protein
MSETQLRHPRNNFGLFYVALLMVLISIIVKAIIYFLNLIL